MPVTDLSVTFFTGWLYVPFIIVYHAFFFLGRRSKDLLLWFTFFDSCSLAKIGEQKTGDNDLVADMQPVLTLLWCSKLLLMWILILFCVYKKAQKILYAFEVCGLEEDKEELFKYKRIDYYWRSVGPLACDDGQ